MMDGESTLVIFYGSKLKKEVSVFIYKMSSDEEVAALVVLLHAIKSRKKPKTRSHWLKPWL